MGRVDPVMPDPAPPARWLSIVGIGEDGVEGLSPIARGLVASADIVFGGERHLKLAAPLITGEAKRWPSPFSGAVGEVLAERGRQVCVLASGDPFFYGIGSVLAAHVAPDETVVVPAPSSFSLAAARLGWALPDLALVSLHGRALDRIRPQLHPGARVLALTSDREGPAGLAGLLAESGFGASRLTVLEALGGPHERVRTTTAAQFKLTDVAELNIVAIEVEAPPGARVLAYAPGLADDLFEHDGQITKREIRAVTLSALAPLQGRVAVGHRRGVGLDRRRVDAGSSVAARRCHRGPRRPRRPHPAQRRRVRRAGARDRGGPRAGGARRLGRRPMRCSSAAARANRACSTPQSPRCGPAAGWWSMR